MNPVQLPLFTPAGQAYTDEAARRELRAAICESLGRIFGEATVPQRCPECGQGLRVLLHSTAPVAWCACGWVMMLRTGEVAA